MPKKYQKTLSVGLSGLLALGIGVAQAADRMPNVLHEMVPHVVLPETVQYNKAAKNMPGNGYTGANAPFVGTYVAHPSYQVPYTTVFKTVGQSVYPVSPPVLPQPLTKQESDQDISAIEKELSRQNSDVMNSVAETDPKTKLVSEPIRLASAADDVVPMLPAPSPVITQTGIFCQQPADPPSAWAFSSPIFKIASVPAGWGGGQIGSINQNGIKRSGQQVAFQPFGGADAAANGAAAQGLPQGTPYSTFQMGRPADQNQNAGPQAHVLPNGMVLLTMPPNHHNCGLIRCRADHQPRTLLLPPAPAGYSVPQPAPQETTMMPNFGTPMIVMTPMGPMLMGQQQMPAFNPMTQNAMLQNPMLQNPMAFNAMGMNSMAANPIALMNMNSAMNSSFSPIQQVQMTTAQSNPAAASQAAAEPGSDMPQTTAETADAAQTAQPMTLIATPYGYYAVQTSAGQMPAGAASQLAQMQVPAQSQLGAQLGVMNPYVSNPYMGVSAAPFGYVAMNPMTINPMGTPFAGGQGGMSVSDMIQIMTFLNNNNKPHQRRARLMERIAERRENRKAAEGDDPFAQLMQAWTTPYLAQGSTLQMPSRNAYPYGYFGVQASPMNTANYGGYHNLYFGSTSYPGVR